MYDGLFARRVFAAFGGVAIAFVIATLLADWRTISIDRATDALRTGAIPNMESLSTASDAVKDIAAAADEYPTVAPVDRAVARANIERLLADCGRTAPALSLAAPARWGARPLP